MNFGLQRNLVATAAVTMLLPVIVMIKNYAEHIVSLRYYRLRKVQSVITRSNLIAKLPNARSNQI